MPGGPGAGDEEGKELGLRENLCWEKVRVQDEAGLGVGMGPYRGEEEGEGFGVGVVALS